MKHSCKYHKPPSQHTGTRTPVPITSAHRPQSRRLPCFSPAGAGGRSNRAMLAELKKRMLTKPPTSPQTKIASLALFGLDLFTKQLALFRLDLFTKQLALFGFDLFTKQLALFGLDLFTKQLALFGLDLFTKQLALFGFDLFAKQFLCIIYMSV